jgi:hypothetical protein
MVIVAQSVRALDCGSRGRGFEPRLSPGGKAVHNVDGFFIIYPKPQKHKNTKSHQTLFVILFMP